MKDKLKINTILTQRFRFEFSRKLPADLARNFAVLLVDESGVGHCTPESYHQMSWSLNSTESRDALTLQEAESN